MGPSLIRIGVHVHAEPDRLLATLASVRAHTPSDVEMVLLPDGPDRATTSCIDTHPELRALLRLGTDNPVGVPACFNRLAASGNASTIVLLESGSIVGPDWLALLLAVLEEPGMGLAGPSTNRSWNEQQLFPNARPTLADVIQTSTDVRRRFGSSHRTLEPLHSLADFCYAVRREVVEAIGAADEVYGLGPCWEMDYNIRAARAGFAGAFVPGAYVFRHPMTARRCLEESRRFETSRRLYQDRFCGLRLRGAAAGYQPHCRGDACEHFSPAGLVNLTLALPNLITGAPVAADPPPSAVAPADTVPGPVPVPSGQGPAAGANSRTQWPLVSALMPTRDRPDLAAQAARYFLAQDYPNMELVVVDDGPPGLGDYLPPDPRIRHVHTGQSRSVGAMRNHACELASGEILVQWDDDDWFGPERLSRQATPIIEGRADITALRDAVMFDVSAWQFWMCDPELHRRLFVQDVHGGTLMFHRRAWERMSRYPDVSLREDAVFLDQAVRGGCRLEALSADGLFLYVRHSGNTWRFRCGEFVDPRRWRLVGEPTLPAADRAFYAARSP